MTLGIIFLPAFSEMSYGASSDDYQASPPFVSASLPPLVMLVMGRNHKLYYEAYNDASDLDGDGELDIRYNPDIDYYGYFDSYKYYSYSTTDGRFDPAGETADKKAPDGNYWSGDFLNYLTMTRMDCLRKVLYGGYRSTDSSTETVLERSFVPQDAHSWGKEYYNTADDGYAIEDYTPLSQPIGGSRHLFANTTLSDGGNPLLRVLQNSIYRIWEWVAIERPVAGDRAEDGDDGPLITDNGSVTAPADITPEGSYFASTGDDITVTIPSQDMTTGGTAGVVTDVGYGNPRDEGYENAFDDNNTTQWLSWGCDSSHAAFCPVWIQFEFDFSKRITSYTLTTGDDKESRDPKTWKLQASNDGSNWTDIDTVEDGALPSARRQLTTFTCDSPPAEGVEYLFYRLYVTAKKGTSVHDCGNHWCLQLAEIELIGEGEETISDPHEPENAFDDDTDTQWLTTGDPSTDEVYIGVQFPSGKNVLSYTVTSGTLEARDPMDWSLQASNDGSSWITIDTRTNESFSSRGETQTYECSSPPADDYLYYRLVITAKKSADEYGVAIAEIEMMDTTESIPATATLDDYTVKVKVCDDTVGVETNAKLYPSGVYKPIGILQRHGESDRMYFGLLTGSYTKNTSGGVLRKNITSIRNEINTDTGEFLYQDDNSVDGIIKTIDKFRIVDFNYSSHSYSTNCGWITTRAINEGECRMWGNPVAEMMYECLRYFAGKKAATSEFTYGADSSYDDNELDLPKPDWLDPYTNGEDLNHNDSLDTGEDINANTELDGYDYCAKPFMLVLSDISPTYDSDQLPGSKWEVSVSDELSDINVEALADTISTEEGEASDHFIGQSGSTYDGACTSKSITGFGDIRGLCPEEPTKQGSYYAAAVAYHGIKTDLHTTAENDQNVNTYCIGLASPLPNIDIQIGDSTITLVPFAKSVGGQSISATEGNFQPTNTIVDFFVEQISSTYGKFRINFEDVEQGADHDMDAIVEYEYQVQDASGTTVTDPDDGTQVEITLNSTYAAGDIIQHMGYIISGSTADGTYLEVRDEDTGCGSDPDYFLDTPPGESPDGDWDDDTCLPLSASRTFEPGTSPAATLLTNPLWYAAKWGGFEDYNDNDLPDQDNEWDQNGDGVPDTYFYVQNPLKLEEELNQSFADILRKVSSGTAASVISQTRSGEGAVYQAVFYPELKGSQGNAVSWAGAIHSIFLDDYGNMREDSNHNQKLDVDPDTSESPQTDRIIVFDDTVLEKYVDDDSDGEIDTPSSPEYTGAIDDTDFLWTSTEWLNEMTDTDVIQQRTNYSDVSPGRRYIFTFADSNANMIADTGEQVDFECFSLPDEADLTDTSEIFPYINLNATFGDEPFITYDGEDTELDTFRLKDIDDFKDYLKNQSQRVINFIRGEDQDTFTSSTSPTYELEAMRSRKIDYDGDGDYETWRLGDIVYSTPTLVGEPSDEYNLLYKDTSYAYFLSKYQHRRQVVYVGGNDGMFHAFNGGFFNSSDLSFNLTVDFDGNGSGDYDVTGDSAVDDVAAYPLGSELWAYIPYNLLPHLYWLTETSYPHVFYCDLKPKIFDAKVFASDDTHPYGWGTILVGGMRFGGGEIVADMDKTDGNTQQTDDRTMSSAYFILDITDPENAPTLIAEINFDNLGYTTCYPAAIPMKDKDDSGIHENEWYLAFGSGPADSNGKAGTLDSLQEASSQQSGKLYIVDLKALVLDKELKTLDGSSNTFTAAPASSPAVDYYQSLDTNTFISDPVSVDYNLDYSADVLYFGTVQGNSDGWGGKVRRVVINNDIDPATWDGDNILFDAGKPITAACTAALDDKNKRWVYVGTGRFFVGTDKNLTEQMSYYGFIEPFSDTNNDDYMDDDEPLTWVEISADDLIDVSTVDVYDDQTITNLSGIMSWAALIDEVDDSSTSGWYIDFQTSKEMNIGQASLLGEVLNFTTYIPSSDICSYQGESLLYTVYYKTGTAYYESVVGYSHDDKDSDGVVDEGEKKMTKIISLGDGLTITPNIHSGREDGSKVFIQTSTGDIISLEQDNPGATKSGITSWRISD